MPIHEYACETCGGVHKIQHGFSENVHETCPRCNEPLKRIPSAPSLSLGRTSSPTQARYARLSSTEERAIEANLQRHYNNVPIPELVKHDPWKKDSD